MLPPGRYIAVGCDPHSAAMQVIRNAPPGAVLIDLGYHTHALITAASISGYPLQRWNTPFTSHQGHHYVTDGAASSGPSQDMVTYVRTPYVPTQLQEAGATQDESSRGVYIIVTDFEFLPNLDPLITQAGYAPILITDAHDHATFAAELNVLEKSTTVVFKRAYQTSPHATLWLSPNCRLDKIPPIIYPTVHWWSK